MSYKQEIKTRLLSLDALRGFDMIWILGAEGIFSALFVLTGWPVWEVLDGQFKHSEWHGFTFYDLIFPLFIFLSGVTLGLAQKNLIGQSLQQRKKSYKKALSRLFILCLLGIIYNHGWGQGIPFDLEKIRYSSVLMRIGIAWFFCAMIVWHFQLSMQVVIALGLLFVYWIFQVMIPAPMGYSGELIVDQSWNAWFDQNFLPGITYKNMSADPEGLLSNVPAIVNALAGAFAGRFIASSNKPPVMKVIYLFLAGLSCVVISWLWGFILPINKTLWTSSFVLMSVGYSLILLALFYFIFDVKNNAKIAVLFAVIGMNSILLYLLSSIFKWSFLVDSLFGGLISAATSHWQPLMIVLLLVLLQWLLAKVLSANKIFLRV